MERFLIITLVVFFCGSGYAQENPITHNVDFNGYIQIRGVSNFDDYTSLSVRRLKLWIKSQPDFSKHWSYKIQSTFTSLQQEKFFLQDVKIGYKTGLFSFDLGQFVPKYSLQRFQPDYEMPSIERAMVINTLIPDGSLGVRDIGLQANFHTKNNFLQSSLGLFNGYGIKEYRFNSQGYMLSHKSEFNIPLNNSKIKFGYSLQYRYAEDLQLPFIFQDTVIFSGNDFRYNLFVMFKSKPFELQAEYLNADFDGQTANGYYLLSAINFRKNQLVLSFEDYNDLIEETSNKPYYRLGYNYLINNKIKLSFDNYFQMEENRIGKYYASIQLQIFLK